MVLRQRLLILLVVAAALLPNPGIASAQDFGDFDPFIPVEMNAPGSLKNMADPTGNAPTQDIYSFHMKSGYCSNSKYGDGVSSDCKAGSSRTSMRENVTSTKKNGNGQPKSAWYGFAIYFPKDDPFGEKQTKGHHSFAYWHNGHCPHLDFRNFSGSENTLSLSTTVALGGYDCADGVGLKIADFAELQGHWNRFEVFVNWSAGDDGEAKVYLEGKFTAHYKGPTLTKGFEAPNYFVFGTYVCCTRDVKEIKPHTVLYSAVTRSPTRDGLLVVEDKKRLSELRQLLQRLGCEPGGVSDKLSDEIKAAALSCRQFPTNEMPAELSAGSLWKFVQLYSAPGANQLPKGKNAAPRKEVASVTYPDSPQELGAALLTAEFQVTGGEMLAKATDDAVQFDSDITLKIKNNKDVSQLAFIAVGQYYKNGQMIDDLKIILQNGVKDKKALSECPSSVETFPDGTHHPVIRFSRTGNSMIAQNGQCLISKLPKKLSKSIEFILNNFSDIGVGMAKTGSIKLVRHNGVRSLFAKAATGELKILAANP